MKSINIREGIRGDETLEATPDYTLRIRAVFAAFMITTISQQASALAPYQPPGPSPGGGTYIPPPQTENTPNSPFVSIRWKTENSALLQWIDKSSVETGFRLEQEESKGQWRLLESFDPLYKNYLSETHEIPDLAQDTGYCFRVVAFNESGDSESSPLQVACTHTTRPGSCLGTKYEEILALANSTAATVSINCDVNLEPNQVVTKRLIFKGSRANGVTVDLNGAILNGGLGTFNEGKDMIEVLSGETKKLDAEGAYTDELSTYERPENITIKNGNIRGSIRVWGMSKNGQGDPNYEKKKDYNCPTYYSPSSNTGSEVNCEIPKSNQLKKSSRLPGHTARAQANAPTNIIFDSLTITGIKRNPLYFAPGVTNSKLTNSEIKGRSDAVAIYFDAESAGNTIKNNYIHVSTKDHTFEKWDRPLIAIDGSGDHIIVNNLFSNLSHGGIYFYRNCGEGGVIRHSTPSYNRVINNIFYYKDYQGDNPSVYLGSHDRGSWFHDTLGFCEHDSGYPFGSSASDRDYATFNAIVQNQIYNNFSEDMIKINNPSINSSNYIEYNETVTEETVDKERLAGCYTNVDNQGFLLHGESFKVSETQCLSFKYTCENSDLIKQSVSEGCLSWD